MAASLRSPSLHPSYPLPASRPGQPASSLPPLPIAAACGGAGSSPSLPPVASARRRPSVEEGKGAEGVRTRRPSLHAAAAAVAAARVASRSFAEIAGYPRGLPHEILCAGYQFGWPTQTSYVLYSKGLSILSFPEESLTACAKLFGNLGEAVTEVVGGCDLIASPKLSGELREKLLTDTQRALRESSMIKPLSFWLSFEGRRVTLFDAGTAEDGSLIKGAPRLTYDSESGESSETLPWGIIIPEMRADPVEGVPLTDFLRSCSYPNYQVVARNTADFAKGHGFSVEEGDVVIALERARREFKAATPCQFLSGEYGLFARTAVLARSPDPAVYLMGTDPDVPKFGTSEAMAIRIGEKPEMLRTAVWTSDEVPREALALNETLRRAWASLVIDLPPQAHDGGFLTQIVRTNDYVIMEEDKTPYSPGEILMIIGELAGSLHQLHERGYAHRNLGAHSTLLHKTPAGKLAAAAVDITPSVCRISSREGLFKRVSDPNLVDPEFGKKILESRLAIASPGYATQDPRAKDMWALGLLLFSLLVPQADPYPSFKSDNVQTVLEGLSETCRGEDWVDRRLASLGIKVSEPFLPLLRALLNPDSRTRIKALEAHHLVSTIRL